MLLGSNLAHGELTNAHVGYLFFSFCLSLHLINNFRFVGNAEKLAVKLSSKSSQLFPSIPLGAFFFLNFFG
jgi:hypothetical protein